MEEFFGGKASPENLLPATTARRILPGVHDSKAIACVFHLGLLWTGFFRGLLTFPWVVEEQGKARIPANRDDCERPSTQS